MLVLKRNRNRKKKFLHIYLYTYKTLPSSPTGLVEFCLVLDDINGVCIEETVKNEIYFTFRNLLSSLVCQRRKKKQNKPKTLGNENLVHLSKNAKQN